MPTDTNLDRAIYDLLSHQCPAMWLGFPIGTGNVYWVDSIRGVVGNSGIRPDLAVPSITEALTLCAIENNDYIMVIEDWQEAATVTVNITRVHIIGLSNYLRLNSNHSFVALNATGDFPIFTITNLSQNCEIAGFNMGGGATSAGIENITTATMGAHIHDCTFGHIFSGDTPQDGIRIEMNATNIRIEHCTFLGTPTGKGTLTRDGIRWQAGNVLNGTVINNQFIGIPAVCFNGLNMGGDGGVTIQDNIFECIDAQGAAITLGVTVFGCLVVGNKAIYGPNTAAMVNNPYLDQTVAAPFNAWAGNYKGNALIDPA